jgi:hypothetical protein
MLAPLFTPITTFMSRAALSARGQGGVGCGGRGGCMQRLVPAKVTGVALRAGLEPGNSCAGSVSEGGGRL